MSDKLTPLDAGFLEVEDSDSHASLAIGALVIAEGPVPTDREFLERLSSRIRFIPHGTDCLHTVPVDLAAPTWTADPNFDPARHVMRIAVPSPGRLQDVAATVAWIMSERLDRDRPLWQCWLIEGLEADRWAVLTKAHHSLVDGVSGARLFDVLFDSPPESEPVGDNTTSTSGTASEKSASLYSTFIGVSTAALGAPVRVSRQLLRRAAGFAHLLGDVLTPSRRTTLIGPIGSQRRYATANVRMQDVKAICSTFDVTVNDVALACVTGALRSLLLHRNEDPDGHSVRCLVPVSVRTPGGDVSPHNEVSLLLPFLPVDVPDPVDRLQVIHERLSRYKRGGESRSGHFVTTLAQYVPFVSSAWFVRLAARVPQQSIVTVVTDIPGPTRKCRLMGREIVSIYPFVPIAVRLRLGFALLSYSGQFAFGITADYDSVPEIDLLPTFLESELRILVSAQESSVREPDDTTESGP
ncbi:wax ester/triacylglycerol synthase family O-acyltransferase [Rhodococcus sp. AD45-ID]|uniref:Diacylglycerol O-acyltransferase n=1 Tax=Nocardia globerula TaxID=1818 RepID=A0A652YMK6_NOCGL|nr:MULTISPECIES: wax ester/triacylglycerol synthase family O-acyltransferase [Rhodococcus]NMD62169.1 wax ester/triacylglycerol synthase family O-acyltransferase [Nocardia globerula]KJF22642.1 putative diacylglycerol O-acyltransferase tgs1 [Rhodococcus sp. AD45]MCE4263552.1 wax ester/triacylglycerol synthase family O-acyltransferase [Rhodococcus globerulus]PSR40234.1 wax ester/triacylglycerol synthase family O-acyltransferase [Rhodococcus sp. AD45-ID]PVX65740.1 WS/DGAT/MGAT family acyltransfera